ncbi:PTS lactose/cellobiose transporter subunit IIA [Geobacillus stearothermophilus]|uniref:PTS lactose/cellobiose transporter subunit IIA n=1 Tax=Geobacillus stearothermophilus TaxID=1422 RepID=UPI003D214742
MAVWLHKAIAAAKQGETIRSAPAVGAGWGRTASRSRAANVVATAGRQSTAVTLLMVRAQDHLMTAIAVKELAAEFVDLYEHIQS